MYTLKELSQELGIPFKGDGDFVVTHACGLGNLSQGGLAFLTNPDVLSNVPLPRKSIPNKQYSSPNENPGIALIVPPSAEDLPANLLLSKDPLASHVQATQLLHPAAKTPEGIHPSAVVEEGVRLGAGVSVGPRAILHRGAVVGDGTSIMAGCVVMHDTAIGENCVLYPNVTVYHNCVIGNRVTLHSGVVIGADGHGYYQRKGINLKIPQIGRAVLEDDVEIGANSTVDRGRFEDTVVKQGTKIDDLCLIAHNVVVGEQSLISGQSGIAGSTKTGHHLTMGGQSCIRDNVTVANHVTLAGRGAISNHIKQDKVLLGGAPAQPMIAFAKSLGHINNLSDLFKRVKQLEEQLENQQKPPAGQ